MIGKTVEWEVDEGPAMLWDIPAKGHGIAWDKAHDSHEDTYGDFVVLVEMDDGRLQRVPAVASNMRVRREENAVAETIATRHNTAGNVLAYLRAMERLDEVVTAFRALEDAFVKGPMPTRTMMRLGDAIDALRCDQGKEVPKPPA